MRPRVFPAEDDEHGDGGHRWLVAASMRPRVFPAEDADLIVRPKRRTMLQ